eukprot:m.137333 g.137333  ORF g.137333 m.137333 type:complete len:116 (-) comp23986_c0_seq2:129-476(-)
MNMDLLIACLLNNALLSFFGTLLVSTNKVQRCAWSGREEEDKRETDRREKGTVVIYLEQQFRLDFSPTIDTKTPTFFHTFFCQRLCRTETNATVRTRNHNMLSFHVDFKVFGVEL